MIDKDEYPQTAELERRCVAILADLWHAPDPDDVDRLLDHRLQRGVHARRDGAQAALGGSATPAAIRGAAAQPGDGRQRPGLLGEVLHATGRSSRAWCRWRATGFHLDPPSAVAALCDENTIGVVAILGSTFDGSYEPVAEICAALDELQDRTAARTSRCTSTARPAR